MTKWPDMEPDQRRAVLDWVVDTCILYGATQGTAFAVAGMFATGLDVEHDLPHNAQVLNARKVAQSDGYPATGGAS